MAADEFFNNLDKEVNAQEKEQKQREQKIRHFSTVTEAFITKLKPVIKPYIDGLKERGFKIDEKDNGLYYSVEVTNPQTYKSAQIGTTHSPFSKDDFYYVLSNFEEYGRQNHVIDESFPKEKIVSIIETTFKKIV